MAIHSKTTKSREKNHPADIISSFWNLPLQCSEFESPTSAGKNSVCSVTTRTIKFGGWKIMEMGRNGAWLRNIPQEKVRNSTAMNCASLARLTRFRWPLYTMIFAGGLWISWSHLGVFSKLAAPKEHLVSSETYGHRNQFAAFRQHVFFEMRPIRGFMGGNQTTI